MKFFDGVAEPAVLRRWTRLADGIKGSLHRLFDPGQVRFLAGSVDCRQVNVWANGLAYWLVDDRTQKKIADWYFQHREQIFKFGYTPDRGAERLAAVAGRLRGGKLHERGFLVHGNRLRPAGVGPPLSPIGR